MIDDDLAIEMTTKYFSPEVKYLDCTWTCDEHWLIDNVTGKVKVFKVDGVNK